MIDVSSGSRKRVLPAVIHTTCLVRCLVVSVFLLYSLFGHASRILGLVGVAVDSPVCESLVDVMDAYLTDPGSLDMVVWLSG